MSTEPIVGENESAPSTDPHTAAAVPEVGKVAAATAAQKAEAAKLFEKLFANSAPSTTSPTTLKKTVDIPPPVVKEVAAGETFTRKVADDAEAQSFQRIATAKSDGAIELPERFVEPPQEVSVPPPLQKNVEPSPVQTKLRTQDIPSAVDAVVSDQVKAEVLAKVKAAKKVTQPELNFPARINNLKTQHDTLRARLASLE